MNDIHGKSTSLTHESNPGTNRTSQFESHESTRRISEFFGARGCEGDLQPWALLQEGLSLYCVINK
jgi:hypothetical protein